MNVRAALKYFVSSALGDPVLSVVIGIIGQTVLPKTTNETSLLTWSPLTLKDITACMNFMSVSTFDLVAD